MRTYEDELLEEYYRGQTNGFHTGYANALTKAIKWLDEHLLEYWGQQNSDPSNLLIDFKKAMEL